MKNVIITSEERLKNIIKNNTKKSINVDNINDDTDLILDLEFNSMSIIQLVVDIETEFNIELNDDILISDILTSYKKLKENVINLLD